MKIGSKKSLGQHFLNAKGVVNDIIKIAGIKNGEAVLEIGPGKGVLTEALLLAGAMVVSVEKDERMIAPLKEKFTEEIKSGQFTLINADILKFDLKKYKLNVTSYKLVANIPYYITGEILRKFIGGEIKPSRAVLLVQKEVAERIAARDNKESILSVSVKAYGAPKYVKKVPARYFSPPPKVDSAILLIDNIGPASADKRKEALFFEIVKTGFGHKRKMLFGNLKVRFGANPLREAFNTCGLDEKTRAENITLEDWHCLSRELGA
jgi:16S rRNA (adenine1518-N6/adenine1519-N6)-dimethyltransferase